MMVIYPQLKLKIAIFFRLCVKYLGIRCRSYFSENLDDQTFKNSQIMCFMFTGSIELSSLLKCTKKQINITLERLKVITSNF